MLQNYKHNYKPIVTKNINITEYDQKKNPKRVLHIGEMKKTNVENITIAEYEKGDLFRLIRAKTGSWLKDGSWLFNQGVMHNKR